MRVQVLRAWPRRFDAVWVDLPDGAKVADALAAAGWGDDPEVVAHAVFGQRVDRASALREGDRLELLRPLEADPKQARRERVAQARRAQGRR